MKKRLTSAIIALAILIPVIIIGGDIFNVAVYVFSLLGLKEFMGMKESKKGIPNFIKLISYVFLTIIILYNSGGSTIILSMDYRLISGLFLSFLLPTVLYHDRSKYSINDAFYLIGGVFFLSLSMILLINIRSDLYILVYLILITTVTDTFAYLTGTLIGKHKLLESISPNKTWEGTISGTVFGVFVSSVFYITVINPEINIFVIILISLFLSLIGQFGDLVFSAIKRYFDKKDFSNIMPGHGGVLDRLDSLIFVLLGFMFFISLI